MSNLWTCFYWIYSHGFQPGELESDVGQIVANTVLAAWNVKRLPPTSFIKISKTIQKPSTPMFGE